MSLYSQAPDPSDTTDTEPDKTRLYEDIRDLFHDCNRTTDEARDFLRSICSPYDPRHERPYRVAMNGNLDRQRWVEPYRDRLTQCASIYLRLSEQDTQLLHAGAEDGVHWRGESITQYLDVVNETLRMREMGVPAYRQEVLKALITLEQKAKRESRRAAGCERV